MECTGDRHIEFISFSCPGLFVMVCPCTFPYLRTRTDILMDTGNFISGLTEYTGDKHYKCITRWKISFETLTHFSHSRAAPSQLKKEWVFLNTFFITSQQLHNHKSNLILPPTGALQAIEIGSIPQTKKVSLLSKILNISCNNF